MSEQQFRERAAAVHGTDYEYLEPYTGMKAKILMRHQACGREFRQIPYNHLRGRGCLKCGEALARAYDKIQSKNHLTFIAQATQIHDGRYSYPEEYINDWTLLSIECPSHGVFLQTPSNHLRGHGCPGCAGNRQLTHQDFLDRAYQVHGGAYQYLSEYSGVDHQTTIRHTECGLEFYQTPYKHLLGQGCPDCANNQLLTHKQFLSKANKQHEYEYLSRYTGAKSKLTIRHKTCGYVFQQTPEVHLRSKSCPKCAGNQRLTHKEFLDRACNKHGAEYQYLDEYAGMPIALLMRHTICGREFQQTPARHLDGGRCPYCYSTRYDQQFLQRAHQIHHDEYEYLEPYINANTKMLMRHTICGREFRQSPYNHVNKHQGCPSCKCLGYYNEHFFRQHPDQRDRPAAFYCILFDGPEKFYKIGIATNYKQRLRDHQRYNLQYQVKVLSVQTMPLYQAWQKEQSLKQFFHQTGRQYRPIIKLGSGGDSECFT